MNEAEFSWLKIGQYVWNSTIKKEEWIGNTDSMEQEIMM